MNVVRIIAGEFRRRKLLASPGLTTRPITDRVKETLFERIGDELVDRKVADVFAGTGSLGLEALSRGAKSVVFIESDRRAFELLEQNVATLGVQDRGALLADRCTPVVVSSEGCRSVAPVRRRFF